MDSISKTRLYSIFSGMKQRCYNPNSPNYRWYGAKGVTICDCWMGEDGLSQFMEWALNNGYEEHLTIDRIDSSGPYSPDNCRWISSIENSSRAKNTAMENIEEIAEHNAIKIFESCGYKIMRSENVYSIVPPGSNYPLFLLVFPESIIWAASILHTIGQAREGERPQEAAGGPTEAPAGGGSILTPDTLKAAQEAAQATGEAVPVFVARAVDTQAKRDKASLSLGVNPAKKAPDKKSET